jgi:hypothetical protein
VRNVSQQHQPILIPTMGPKYEDAKELGQPDWAGTSRLACACGWMDSRIAAGTLMDLAELWRAHLTASTYGIPLRDKPT